MGPWEVQNDRVEHINPLTSKEAKAPPSDRSRLREGHVHMRKELDSDSQAMDFDSFAAHFALSPEARAQVARRVREDVEWNAAKDTAFLSEKRSR